MGSGLSMASVNKIKELAEQREYSLALDIVDSQDLTKSLNPQFLRVCGEIYVKNGRYVDARKVLLMAHKLAPAGKRVIYSLIDLYLKMGYKDLAKKYYDIYMADADENHEETAQVRYIYAKANSADCDELESYLYPTYVHNLDYDWSFELFMVYQLQGETEEADILCSDFNATFKNSEYGIIMADIMSGKKDVGPYFDVYSKENIEDDQDAEEQLRQEEAVLLEADYLRINPKEAEITIMVDDYEEVDVGTKRKLKKFLKQQEKAERAIKEAEEAEAEAAKELEESEDASSEEAVTETVTAEDDSPDTESKEDTVTSEEDSEEHDTETVEDTDAPEEEESEDKVSVKGFFKKMFSRKKPQDIEEDSEEEVSEEETDNEESGEVSGEEENIEKEEVEDSTDAEEEVVDSTEADTEADEEVEISQDDTVTQEEQTDNTDTEDTAEDIMKSMTSFDETVNEEDVELVFEDDGEETMQELHNNKHNSIISVDFEEDDFTAESDTIEGLKDDDLANPFEGISAMKKEKEESRFMPKRKTEFVFDDIDLSGDEDDDSDVDDFSVAEDDEFGTMKTHLDEMLDDVTDENVSYDIHMDNVEEYQEDKEFVIDGIEDEPEEEVVISGIEDIPEEAEKEIVFADDEIGDIAEETSEEYEVIFGDEDTEETHQEITDEDVVEEVYQEPEEAFEEVYEEAVEEELEEVYEETTEEELEEQEETFQESLEVPEETYEEIIDEAVVEEDVAEEVYQEPEETFEEVYEEAVEKELEEVYEGPIEEELEEQEEIYEESLEVPEETYEEITDEAVVEEDEAEEVYQEPEEAFEEVYEETVETPVPKKTIDFPVFRSSLFPNHNRKIEQVENNFDEIMTKGQDKIQENLLKEEQMQREAEALLASLGIDLSSINVTSSSIDSIGATLYNEPSRDELKASLKIDSVKKSILRKLKEYR